MRRDLKQFPQNRLLSKESYTMLRMRTRAREKKSLLNPCKPESWFLSPCVSNSCTPPTTSPLLDTVEAKVPTKL